MIETGILSFKSVSIYGFVYVLLVMELFFRKIKSHNKLLMHALKNWLLDASKVPCIKCY